jgi:hypothetical protein
MPAQQRRGLHENQRIPPPPRERGCQHHPPTIHLRELRTLDLPPEHDELLPEQRVLGHELHPGAGPSRPTTKSPSSRSNTTSVRSGTPNLTSTVRSRWGVDAGDDWGIHDHSQARAQPSTCAISAIVPRHLHPPNPWISWRMASVARTTMCATVSAQLSRVPTVTLRREARATITIGASRGGPSRCLAAA